MQDCHTGDQLKLSWPKHSAAWHPTCRVPDKPGRTRPHLKIRNRTTLPSHRVQPLIPSRHRWSRLNLLSNSLSVFPQCVSHKKKITSTVGLKPTTSKYLNHELSLRATRTTWWEVISCRFSIFWPGIGPQNWKALGAWTYNLKDAERGYNSLSHKNTVFLLVLFQWQSSKIKQRKSHTFQTDWFCGAKQQLWSSLLEQTPKNTFTGLELTTLWSSTTSFTCWAKEGWDLPTFPRHSSPGSLSFTVGSELHV